MKSDLEQTNDIYPKVNYGNKRTKLITRLTIFASIILAPIVITILVVLSLMMLGVEMSRFSSSTFPLLTIIYSLCILLLPLGLAAVITALLLRCNQLSKATLEYKKLIRSLRSEIVYLSIYLVATFLCYYAFWYQTFMA